MADRAEESLRRAQFPNYADDTAVLIRALSDPVKRRTAALWLAELGEDRAIPELVTLLDNPDSRLVAAQALGRMRAVQALPRLLELTVAEPRPGVRGWVIGALGEIGDPQVIPLLEAALDDRELRVRHAAVYALGVLGDASAVPALLRARRRERHQLSYPFVGRLIYRKAFQRLGGRRTPVF